MISMPQSSEAESGRKRNTYADISVILSFVSVVIYSVFAVLHGRLMHVKISRLLNTEHAVETGTWLSWPLVSSIHLVSAALAVAAVILSIAALKKRPRRWYPLAFAIFVFGINFFVLP
jgi:hypothetical protein